MTETIRVLIADDHPIVRQGLAIVFDSEEDIEVVAEAEDGEECIQKARELRPDVVVLDINMPNMDGLAALREIVREQPNARILMLTAYAADEQVCSAIRGGAAGFLLKDAPTVQLTHAVRSVHHGTSVLQPAIAQRLFRDDGLSGGRSLEPLTPREMDVLRLIAHGLQNKEIAGRLHLGEQTVLSHVHHILHKLHAANRTQAALYAREHGLA